MSSREEIYSRLSAAVHEMREAHKVAKQRADENEKLPLSEREAGRSEYIRVLLELQATAQAVLDSTPEIENGTDKPPRYFARRQDSF